MTNTLKPLIKPLLLSNNYWIISKPIFYVLGLDATFLLSHFSEAENTIADKDGWFYQTVPTVERMTKLGRFRQEEAIEILAKKGILEQVNKGMPRKRYFRLNYDNIANVLIEGEKCMKSSSTLENNVPVGSATTCQRVVQQRASKDVTPVNKESTYKEINNKEIKIKTSMLQSEEMTSKEVVVSKDFKDSLIEKWNSIESIPNIKALRHGTKRYDSLKARLEEFSEGEILQAINNITKSDFLQGKNNRGWTITFDWFVKPNNFIKVLENQYKSNDTDTVPAAKEKKTSWIDEDMEAEMERILGE